VVKEVPPNSVVVGVPGRITHRDGRRVPEGIDLNMTDLPDPVAKAIQCIVERLQSLEDEVGRLRREPGPARAHAPEANALPLPAATKFGPR
jgi:serine O-acetyltransferase